MTESYRPIDCGLHDALQLRVLRGRPVEVAWTDEAGARRCRRDAPTDVFSRRGAEFLLFSDGFEIRLDRLVTVDGIRFDPGG